MRLRTWTLKDLRGIAQERQRNKFDMRIAVSGETGNGKSTFLYKFFDGFNGFNAWKHQVYSRKDVMELIQSQKFGYIFDDEGINSGYKRKFWDKEQQKLIIMLNQYRSNYNIYATAIPNFYSLDRDLRSLIKLHIQVIRRGVAILHVAHSGQLYSDDPWDIAYNKKVEEKWGQIKKKDPNYNPPYHKLTTFQGYIYFGDLSEKKRKIYEDVKEKKRADIYENEIKDKDGEKETPVNRLYQLVKERKFTKQDLQAAVLATGLKYNNIVITLNKKLKDEGIKETLGSFLIQDETSSKALPKSNNYSTPMGRFVQTS